MPEPQTFKLRYDGFVMRRMHHARSVVVVDDVSVTLDAMGFHTVIPRSSITAVEPNANVREAGSSKGTSGVHGGRGRWLVNGSSHGLVSISVDPGVRGWMSPFPVKVRRLIVSVEDPAGLIAALATAPPAAPPVRGLN